MRFLLMDTCGSEGSIALADTDRPVPIVASETLPGRTASERLVPAVRRVMEGCAWRLRDLNAIVIVHGPGSFTGVRVGLSAAKGLSEAAGVPLVAVSRLALLAAKGGEGVVHAVMDAGRGEFYLGRYRAGECLQEALLTAEEVLASAADGTVVVCEPKVAEALATLKPQLVPEPAAADALPVAASRAEEGSFDDSASLDANYLRRTDSQIFAKPKSAAQ